ncbi:MAG TPA: DNA polymerase III subunit beta [Luteitalea sp.]|nr:DNA polymerase III subunit beta [Luteitalea sp.]
MELVVRKNDLLRELQLFQGIVERKNTMPVLANVLLRADGDKVELVATDLDVGLRSSCVAQSLAKPGTLTLPAKKLFEIVKALPETDIRIEQNRSGVTVAAERFESHLSTLPADDFPQLPGNGDTVATLPREPIRQMVSKTMFAITGEDTRYYLNGALFVLKPDSMSLVATDGHRLALVTVQAETGAAEGKALLPKKTMQELSRLLGDGDSDVVYERAENHLFFTVGTRRLFSRMIDAQFPAFERVIPKNNDKLIEFERDRLTSAIRRVALLSNERSRAVRFLISAGKVEVTSQSPDLGEAKEELLVAYDGPDVQICFNAQYVTDFLAAVETEQVSLSFRDEMSQAVMKPVGADGYDYTYVIMPMRP